MSARAVKNITEVKFTDYGSSVEEALEGQMVDLDVLIPYDMGELVDLFHRRGLIEREEHTEEGTRIAGRLPRELTGRFGGLLENARSDAPVEF